jgi:hypothetical protein
MPTRNIKKEFLLIEKLREHHLKLTVAMIARGF